MLLLNKNEQEEGVDMARLSRDALMVLAHINAHDTYEIMQIAVDVFGAPGGANKSKAAVVAVTRARRAALSLVGRKQVKAIPSATNLVSIKSMDGTGGSIQAQSIMNFMVRGGVERRTGEDRRERPPEVVTERRQQPDRRIVRPARSSVSGAPPIPQKADNTGSAKVMSAFDIPKQFELKK